MLRLHMGYPNLEDERAILRDRKTFDPLNDVVPVMTQVDILDLQQAVSEVRFDETLLDHPVADRRCHATFRSA